MLFQTFTRPSANPIWIPGLNLSDMNYVNLSTFHIIHTLLSIPFEPSIQNPSSPSCLTPGSAVIPELQESLRVSLLLFFYANWRMHDTASPIFRTLTSQLKSSLDVYISAHRALFSYPTDYPTDHSTAQHHDPDHSNTNIPSTRSLVNDPAAQRATHELLLWILCLGAHASAGQRERPWFVLQVACGMRTLGLRGWEELRGVVGGFFYNEDVYEASFKRVWEEG